MYERSKSGEKMEKKGKKERNKESTNRRETTINKCKFQKKSRENQKIRKVREMGGWRIRKL